MVILGLFFRIHVDLPEYITKNKILRALVKNRSSERYNDNLEIFRCSAVHKGHYLSKLETTTTTLYETWCTHLNSQANAQECHPYNSYQSLILNEELHEFEKCFEVCVNLFKLCEDVSAQPERRSVCSIKDQMNLNIYDSHLSYFTNLKAYSRKYQCQMCDTFFKTAWRCLKHEFVKTKPSLFSLVDFTKERRTYSNS